MSGERQLRLVQSGVILFLVACFFVMRIGTVETHAISALQWLIIVAAIWCAISGFTVQRKVNHPRKPSRRSTPASRWKAGHLYRLLSATSVGLYGVLLHYTGAPEWLVNVFLCIAIVLLLIWKPGSAPVPGQP
jgi:hypothetical protein